MTISLITTPSRSPIVTKISAIRSRRTVNSRVVVLARAGSVDAAATFTHPIVKRCVSHPGTEHWRCFLSEAKLLGIVQFLTVECVLRAVAVAAGILFAGAISPDYSLAVQSPGGCCERGREQCRANAPREERCTWRDPLCWVRKGARKTQLALCETSYKPNKCDDTCCILRKCPPDVGPIGPSVPTS